MEKINKAILSLKKRKTPDYHGVTIEYIIYAGNGTSRIMGTLTGSIFQLVSIPESLKTGLLTPVFETKEQINKLLNIEESLCYLLLQHLSKQFSKTVLKDIVLEI